MARLTSEELAAWVAASCERHGVPVKVTDAAVVDQVAVLLTGQPARHAKRGGRRAVSDTPHDVDP